MTNRGQNCYTRRGGSVSPPCPVRRNHRKLPKHKGFPFPGSSNAPSRIVSELTRLFMRTESADRRRVLIVDDDQQVLDLLIEVLQQEGYEVVVATDGCGALAEMSSFAPDIVISDVVMPVMDGIELCQRLKQDERTVDV